MNVLVNTGRQRERRHRRVCLLDRPTGVGRERRLGNGAFTKAMVEGIALGKADLMRDGVITTSGLDFFVERRVRTLTEDKQNPVMGRPPDMPDFTIAQVSK